MNVYPLKSAACRLVCVLMSANVVSCAVDSRKPILFNGTYYANVTESHLLPGQRPPNDFLAIYKDDGNILSTVQSFTDEAGRRYKYEWSGACDGMPRPIAGVEAPAEVMMSCRRLPDGALVNVLTGSSGYTHVETCTLTNRGRREVCQGTATSPDGVKKDFAYIFERK